MELKMDEKTLNQLIEQVEMKIANKELPVIFDNIDMTDKDVVKIIEMLKKISTLFAETLSDYIDLLCKERKKNQDLEESLRNSLAIIKGNVDVLALMTYAEQGKLHIDIIKQNLDRIEKILENRKL